MKTQILSNSFSGKCGAAALGLVASIPILNGAGLLEDTAGSDAIRLTDHSVQVEITESVARTTVRQTFLNQSGSDLEAVYTFPLPKDAVLSEVHLTRGDRTQSGEVVERARAEALHDEAASEGRATGLATLDSIQRFEFRIYPVPAHAETILEVVYYEVIEVDSAVGVYRYPLQENGTDDRGRFWSPRDEIEGRFTFEAEVHSAWPLRDIRVPGLENGREEALESGGRRFAYQAEGGRLDEDIVLYYRLEENLPGRVDVLAYKGAEEEPGTFLAMVTPAMDLKLLPGTDTVFVLDISGSMETKLPMLIAGVEQAIGKMRPDDRFRIVLFNNGARELTRGWTPVNEQTVAAMIREVRSIRSEGGTHFYAGIKLALGQLDPDRATNCILVTDGVANVGEVRGPAFRALLDRYDIRLFSFVLGNGANWPLMETLSEATGGYARGVSNSQDIVGEILLAQNKVTRQSLRGARIHLTGASRPYGVTGNEPGKLFYGEQVLVLGRYAEGGSFEFTLDGQLTGEAKSYRTTVELPEVDTSMPELERIWALHRMKSLDPDTSPESREAALDLALEYQFVTEHTAMLLLHDEDFEKAGIERRNAARSEREAFARQNRSPVPPTRQETGEQRAFQRSAPSFGGGALGPGWFLVGFVGLLAARFFRRHS